MKHSLTCAVVLAAAAGAAGAQSASYTTALPPTLYGLIDVSVRYTANETPDGKPRIAVADGAQTASRWGVRGVENLGAGLKAVYVLESGFAADTGTLLQDGRLFGRQAFVGISNGKSTVALGRMYTAMHDMVSSFDSFGLANNEILSPQTLQYTGHRYDNMVKYVARGGDVEVTADLSAARNGSEPPGAFNQTGGYDYATVYLNGPWRWGFGFGGQHGVTSYFGATIPAQTQKVWSVSASYQFPDSNFKLLANYINARLEVSDITNNAYQTSFDWRLSRNTQLLGTWTHDEMRNYGGQNGSRDDIGLMFDYYFSARTDFYIEADYNKVADAWLTVASAPSYASYDRTNGSFFAGYPWRSQVMVGLRHRFSK
jgi:predicted porin